jgi:hypothetical protein
MGAPEDSSGRRLARRPVPGAEQPRSTILGVAVPVAPSFLQLDDEDEPVAYDAQRRSGRRSDTALISLSDDDVELVSAPELRPAPSRRRSFFAKFLFVTILLAVSILAAIEISKAQNLPWLDPRPLFFKLWKLAVSKIPWESLPKLPKL